MDITGEAWSSKCLDSYPPRPFIFNIIEDRLLEIKDSHGIFSKSTATFNV